MAKTLVTNLIARTSAFDRNIRRSQTRMVAFGSSAQRVGSMLKGLAVSAGAYVGLRALGGILKRTMENIDATAKMADRIGETTENLISLGHAAEIAGSSQDTLISSLDVLVRRIGETKMGVGQGRYALDKLKISLEDLERLSPAEMFALMSKRIMTLPNAVDRAAAAYYLMGRRGTELLNLMERLSREGLAGVREEAEKLGITFSRIDAAKIEEANDSLNRMKKVLRGICQEIAIKLAPSLEGLGVLVTGLKTGEWKPYQPPPNITDPQPPPEVPMAVQLLLDAEKTHKSITDTIEKEVLLYRRMNQMQIQDISMAKLRLSLERQYAFEEKWVLESLWNYYTKRMAELEKSKTKFKESLSFENWLAGRPEAVKEIYQLSMELEEQLELYEKMAELQTENVTLARYRLALEKQFGDDLETVERFYNSFEERLNRFNELRGKEKDKAKGFDAGEGREIDTSLISVKGLAMGSRDNPMYLELQKQTEYAKQTVEYARQLVGKESLG